MKVLLIMMHLVMHQSRKRSPIWNIDIDKLRISVENSNSFTQVLRYFDIDYVGSSIKTLKNRLDIENINFYAGAVRKVLSSDELGNVEFDVVIIDPPRAGMHDKALKRLVEINANRLVYISCNPSTFARDANLLNKAGYELKRVIPFDMFPHTMHIELVSMFQKM